MDTKTVFKSHALAQCFAIALWLAAVATPAIAQTQSNVDDSAATVAGDPFASDGGQATIARAGPIAAETDAVNAQASADTVEGLILSVTIDGAQVRLDSAMPARVPRTHARPREALQGDVVTVTGMASGEVVARNTVPDTVLNAHEQDGLVRTTRRQIALVLATDRAVDTVRVEAPATQAAQSLDVRAAYANFCKAEPRGKWCPGLPARP